MSLISSVKHFFGLEKQNTSAPQITLISTFEGELASLPPEQHAHFIGQAYEQSEAKSKEFEASAPGQAGKAASFFSEAKDHFALEIYLYKKIKALSGQVTEGIDPELEQRLGRLISYAQSFAKPSAEIALAINGYIQTYEEAILLAEARGEYKLSISENDRWVRLPFLQPDTVKMARKREAVQELKRLCTDCSELALLEFESRVPWHHISTLELIEKAKTGRAALFRIPETEQYYCYLYT